MAKKGRPLNGMEFPRVREAREALRQKAIGIWERYEDMIAKAVAAGEYDVANNAYQFLMTHMPADEDGTKMIDVSVDKTQKADKRSLPTVNIGFAIGGVRQPHALPEVTVIEDPDGE